MSRPAPQVLAHDYPAPGVVLELLKPITWCPPAVRCVATLARCSQA
jgi:hypothetical protein